MISDETKKILLSSHGLKKMIQPWKVTGFSSFFDELLIAMY